MMILMSRGARSGNVSECASTVGPLGDFQDDQSNTAAVSWTDLFGQMGNFKNVRCETIIIGGTI